MTDPAESARLAGLRYVTETGPGIHRRRAGRGFVYLNGHGLVRDVSTLARIRSLVIPPAWREVWISSNPRARIQATGIDAAGRKQYR